MATPTTTPTYRHQASAATVTFPMVCIFGFAIDGIASLATGEHPSGRPT